MENEQENKQEFTIKIKKDNLWKYSTFLLAAVLIIGAFMYFTGDKTTTGQVVNNPADTVSGTTKTATIDDDAILGDKDAPVTIIEFSDYQCPYCRKFWTETYPSLKKEYIDTGKVKLVFRDFPLSSIHPMAQSASEAAECVKEAGGDEDYYKYHDKMFSEQNILDGGTVKSTISFTNDDLKKWAKDLGYDISKCFDSGKFKSEVQKDLSDGSAAGVRATPAFFVNGKLLSGAQPFSSFKTAIDAELV